MFPTLAPNEEVLADTRAYKRSDPKVGDVVVAIHPERVGFVLVKRISAVNPQQTYDLLGDNPDASTDSRQFGAVPLDQIIGKVTHRLII